MRKRRFLAVLAIVALACVMVATVAFADNEVTVTTPKEGTNVGPATDVIGTAPVGSVIIVMTYVYDQNTGKLIRKVPGTRHLTAEDGSFHLRVAMPRISFGTQTKIIYKMHVTACTRTETFGTVVITLYPSPVPGE